jgi:hypothetical protein
MEQERQNALQQCAKFRTEWDKCVASNGKRCEKMQVKFLMCVGVKICPKEERNYYNCNGSIMGSGAYGNQRDCNPQIAAMMKCAGM